MLASNARATGEWRAGRAETPVLGPLLALMVTGCGPATAPPAPTPTIVDHTPAATAPLVPARAFITIDSPASGDTIDPPTVTVSGTGPPGEIVTHFDSGEQTVVQPYGDWTMEVSVREATGPHDLTFYLDDDPSTVKKITVFVTRTPRATSSPPPS